MKFTDKDQFKRGKSVELLLDEFFKKDGWIIREMTQHEERTLCIGDREFSRGDKSYNVEYKSGIQTYHTGNIFLETVSVDTDNTPGWVFTSRADWIVYATILNGTLLILKPSLLRKKIESLRSKFREVKTSNNQNDGYDTHGVIVPYVYAAENLATQVIEYSAPEGSD